MANAKSCHRTETLVIRLHISANRNTSLTSRSSLFPFPCGCPRSHDRRDHCSCHSVGRSLACSPRCLGVGLPSIVCRQADCGFGIHEGSSLRARILVWEKRYYVGAVILGSWWGLSALLIFPSDSVLHQSLLALFAAAAASAAAGSAQLNYRLYTSGPRHGIPVLGAIHLSRRSGPCNRRGADIDVCLVLIVMGGGCMT